MPLCERVEILIACPSGCWAFSSLARSCFTLSGHFECWCLERWNLAALDFLCRCEIADPGSLLKVGTFAVSNLVSLFLSPYDWCCWSSLSLFFCVFSLQFHFLAHVKICIDCSNPLSFLIEFIAAKAKQSALSYGIEALHLRSLLFY